MIRVSEVVPELSRKKQTVIGLAIWGRGFPRAGSLVRAFHAKMERT